MPPSAHDDHAPAHGRAAVVLRPRPRPSIRPWAGHRLGTAAERVGELWLAGPDSVAETPSGPQTLDDLAATAGAALVGRNAFERMGARFPLLVKVIDADAWLSLQVHPDDALAAELYGPRALGKAEAWVVLDAAHDAELVTGPAPDVDAEAFVAAIAAGDLGRDRCEVRACVAGETLFLAAGTVHAIGAGCFVYEIEQPSDITFRISDWGRPETPDRPLHRRESVRAVRPDSRARSVGRDWSLDGGAFAVPEFRLEIVAGADAATRTPAGASLEVVTAVGGTLELAGDGWRETLAPYDTVVVPASVPAYRIEGPAGSLACVGSIP